MEFHLSWTAPLPTCFTAASVLVILGSILAVFAPAPWLIWTAVVDNRPHYEGLLVQLTEELGGQMIDRTNA
ncbi:MAG: hypothetical protein ACREP9_21965, partial [Candidatus Dormibacteraceae bacterium]